MTDDQKAQLWLTIFGLSDLAAAQYGFDPQPGLAGLTSRPKWDQFNDKPTAKAIGQQQWRDAMSLACELDSLVPGLDPPIMGADPDGFIWLTWRSVDGREFALQQHANLLLPTYQWTMIVDGFPKSYCAKFGEYRPIVECLRLTFGERAKDRSKVRMLTA